jgi:hypothetical protein
VNLFDADCDRFKRAFDGYLSSSDWCAHRPAADFWNELSTYSPTRFSEEPASYQLIAKMAFILMHMPCSEAEVEGVFSRMRGILEKRSVRIKRDLLEARLVIQMNGSKMTPDRVAALDDLEGRKDAGPGEGQVAPHVAGESARPGFSVPLILNAREPPRSGGPGAPPLRCHPDTLGM